MAERSKAPDSRSGPCSYVGMDSNPIPDNTFFNLQHLFHVATVQVCPRYTSLHEHVVILCF